jgi:hypothetical protein
MWIIFTLACTNQLVYLESGTYSGNPSVGAVGLLEGADESALQDFQVDIDTSSMTAILYPDSVATELDLFEFDVEEWQVGCPTPLITVRNQTFGFSADFQVATIDLEGAIIFASGCIDETGKNVTEAWLSTESYQEALDIAGGMTGMLKLDQE